MPEIPEDPGRRGAVAIVLRGERFLVTRRSRQVVAPGAFCFPGGGIEGAESDEEALVREIREELGVTVRPLRRVWQSVTPWKVRLSWWLSRLDPDVALQPNPDEVESVQWLAADEMLQLDGLLESNRDFLRAMAAGEIRLDAR